MQFCNDEALLNSPIVLFAVIDIRPPVPSKIILPATSYTTNQFVRETISPDNFEDEIDLSFYVQMLWHWAWLIALSGLFAGIGAFATSQLATPIYQTTATLLVNETRIPGDVNYQDILTNQRIAGTYTEMITRDTIRKKVADILGVDVKALETDVTDMKVTTIRDTQLIRIEVEGISPRLVMAVANTLPQIFSNELWAAQTARFRSAKSSLQEQMNFVQTQMAEVQAVMAKLAPDQETERRQMQEQLARHENTYTTLRQSFENLGLAELSSVDNVILWEPAALPEKPVRPRVLPNILLAAIVGMMLATFVVFVVEYFRDRIQSPDELKRLFDMPLLGAIPPTPGGG